MLVRRTSVAPPGRHAKGECGSIPDEDGWVHTAWWFCGREGTGEEARAGHLLELLLLLFALFIQLNTNSTRIRQQMQRQRFSDTQSMGQPWSCVLANTGTAV